MSAQHCLNQLLMLSPIPVTLDLSDPHLFLIPLIRPSIRWPPKSVNFAATAVITRPMGFIISARPIQRTARPASIIPRTSPPESTPLSVLAPLATALNPVTSQRSLPPCPSASDRRSQLARSKTAFFQTLTKGEIRRFSPSLRPTVAILIARSALMSLKAPLTNCG